LLIVLRRALSLAPLLFCGLVISAPPLPISEEAIQRRFEDGITLMSTQPEEAAEILKLLYQETGSVRIELEFARSLFLAGNLADAKAQFIHILNQPIPITVRDKVEYYLSEIQKRQTLKFTIGLFQDSNPGYVTSTRTVSILGQTLSYQPAQNTNTATGLAVALDAEREIIPQSGYFAQVNVNTVTFQTSAFNKQDLDASFVKRWQGYDYKDLRAGYETMYYGGSVLYNYPYLSSRFIFNQPNQDYYGFMVKGGTLNYPLYTYLNGSQTQANVFYNHNITRNLTAYFEVGGDSTIATESAYSSRGFYGTVGTQIAEDSTQLQASLKASRLQRNYWQSDPFWGQVRQDSGQLYFLSITKRDLYILGLRPSIDITYQSNNSSIPYFSYNKVFGGIFFKNVY
jgi:hypothetical protein